MRLLIKFLLIFLFVNSTAAQYFPSKNYSTTDGLPNNAVRSLFLDSKNVLWIGTENGVSRMENGLFYNISESDGLGHNSCWDISEDKNGNMWFASYSGGISKFDGKKFTVFTTKDGLLADKTRKVFPYKNKMYVGTEQGVSIIDINTNSVFTPEVPDHKEDFISLSFFEYKGEVYFSTIFEGLFKIDESKEKPIIVPVLLYAKSYALGLFGSTLYSANEGFINKYDISDVLKNKASKTIFGKSMVWQFAKDKRNTVFAAAWGVYTPNGGLYQILNDKMIDVSGLYGVDSKILLNVVYDKSKDILYVGSNDKGIYQIRLDKMIDFDLFEGKSIIDFEDLGNQKYILHNKGFTILDQENNLLKTVSRQDFKNVEADYIRKNKRISSKQGIESRDFELNFNIKADGIEFYEIVKHKESFWIGSNIGIFEINRQGKIVAYIPKHSLKIGFTANDKFIETITYAGTRVYDDLHNLKSKHYSKFERHTPQYIVKILNNRGKTYLLSVFNGLYVWHNDQFQSYLADGIWKEKKFKHIAVNDNGQLILAAEFGNVFIVDDTKKFKVLKTISKNEIVGNTILFLEAYKDYIFIGTERGLNIYQNGKIRLIDKEQGLTDAIVTTSHIFENQLWLGTKKGFYKIDLDKVLKAQITVSDIKISNIEINGIGIDIDKSNYKSFEYHSKSINSDYKHNSFLINFIPKGHPFPNKLKFRYRLKTSERWSPYSDKTNLFLPYLPSGNYILEIEVYDSNAGKSTFFKLLNINIAPPFWMTWWFITLSILCVIALSSYFIVQNKKKAKEKALVQKRIAETKLEALLSQMNPHFTFNAMNAIQHFVISNDVDNSLLYISNFAKLMRKTLENSSKQTITIEEELEYLKLYISIENMRFEDRIDYQFKIAPNVDLNFYEIPTMLLQPFVENVFMHAFDESHPNPILIISFEINEEHFLECKIIDNGKGFTITNTQKTHQSKGIQLARERLALLQETTLNPIIVEQIKDEGTAITILLKI